jgi:hypothetical protein
MKKKLILYLIICLVGLSLAGGALAQISAHYDLNWHILSFGGGQRVSTHYHADDALGQLAVGGSTGPNVRLESGFFYSTTNTTIQCYRLTLTHAGSGSDPTATPDKSSGCPALGQYIAGEAISLVANPASGWVVSAWTGTANDASTANTNSLTMPAADHSAGVIYASAPDAYEVDNLCNQAKIIAVDGAIQEHTYHIAADADWVRFEATSGVEYRIEVQIPIYSSADVNLSIYPGCEQASFGDFEETFTPGVRLDITSPLTGPLFIRMSNFAPGIAGPEVVYNLSVREIQTDVPKGGVILLAGRLKLSDPLQANIHYVIGNAYNLYKQQGYTDEEILYLAVDPALPGVDQAANVANFRNGITSWAVGKVGADKPLIIYMMDHGNTDQFFIDEVNQQRINPQDLSGWLDQLEAAVPNVNITVIIEACYSGSFIEGLQSTSKSGRSIIASTTADSVAYATANGARFSDIFLTSLSQSLGICLSFKNAHDAVQALSAIQEPWVDADGNKVPNEAADCEMANDQLTLPGILPEDSWPPYIVNAEVLTPITNQKGTIQAQVRDNIHVARVWAVIYPPSFVEPINNQELIPEDLPTIDLVSQGSEMYRVEYTHFDESGAYRIAIYARDDSGLITGPYVINLEIGNRIFLPLVIKNSGG